MCKFIDNNKELVSEIQNNAMHGRVLYLIEYDNGIKIGVTKDIIKRIKTYTRPWCLPVKSIYLTGSKDAIKHENMCKKAFKAVNKDSREFLDTNISDILNLLNDVIFTRIE